jgi:hypothetical protein
MRRGYRVLIVAIVAIGTNIGLHSAFGWCGNNHWRNHPGNENGCGNYRGHWNGHGGCGETNGAADPWNCAPKNNSVDGVKDTVPK